MQLRHWTGLCGWVVVMLGGCLAAPLLVEPASAVAGAGDEDTQAISQYLPFDMPPYSVLAKSPKKVFPHWHLFPISRDNQDPQADFYNTKVNVLQSDFDQQGFERPLPRAPLAGEDWRVRDMETEIHRAQAIGADGFWMNFFGYDNHTDIDAMLEAAHRINSPFRVLLAHDVVGFNAKIQAQRDQPLEPVSYFTELYTKYGKDPMVFHVGDQVALTGFGSMWVTPADWTKIFANLKAQGIDVYFVPQFMNWRKVYEPYLPISAGLGDWGTGPYDRAAEWGPAAAVAHQQGKIWVMPVRPQEARIKQSWYFEARGSAMLRNGWQAAIDSGSDWVQMVTWNDYGEATEFSPSTGIQYAYYDLCAYYIVWFKTGHAPRIVRDVLYYFHRTQSIDSSVTKGNFIISRDARGEDIIELLAFLKEPGTLKIEVGGHTYTKDAPAGMTSFIVPLEYGTPVFSVERDGKVAATVTSAFPILDKPAAYRDALYHGGSSTRPPVPMTDRYLQYYDK